MKICILCSSTYAKEHRVFYKDALTFRKLGKEVIIIAPYDQPFEIENNIEIIGLPKKTGYLHRILRNFFLFRNAYFKKTDVYYAHDLDSLLVGLILKFLKRKPLIYLCREYYPEKQYYRRGKKFKILGKLFFFYFLKLYERIFYSMSDAIICVNNHMADRFKKFGKHLFVIPHYPSIDFVNKVNNCNVKLPDNTIIYIGGINDERNIKKLLKVLLIIKDKYHYNVNLAIFGNAEKKYLAEIYNLAQVMGISKNIIIGKVPYKQIPALLRQAKIGMLLLKKDNPAHYWAEAVKFFEYAAMGLPVIISDLPANRKLIEICQNGYIVDPDDEFLIAEKCVELLNNPQKAEKMGKAGKKCFLKKFNWEINEQKITKLLKIIEEKCYKK